MYKIVQQTRTVGITERRQESFLTIVPHKWEKDNQLFWPFHLTDNARNRLLREINSDPAEDWAVQDCLLKRCYLPSYEVAEEELCSMEELIFTNGIEKTPILPRAERKDGGLEDLSSPLEFKMPPEDLTCEDMHLAPELAQGSEEFVPKLESDKVADDDLPADCASKVVMLLSNEIDRKAIAASLIHIAENLDEIKRSLAQLTQMNPVQTSNRPDATNVIVLQPISTQAECENLEARLGRDAKYKNEVVSYLRRIIGTTGGRVGEGTDCAYTLVDHVFSRTFLLECSWSGASRSETVKVPIKTKTNILKVFFEAISTRDPQFSYNELHSFFKRVIANKNSRAQAVKRLGTKDSRVKKRFKWTGETPMCEGNDLSDDDLDITDPPTTLVGDNPQQVGGIASDTAKPSSESGIAPTQESSSPQILDTAGNPVPAKIAERVQRIQAWVVGRTKRIRTHFHQNEILYRIKVNTDGGVEIVSKPRVRKARVSMLHRSPAALSETYSDAPSSSTSKAALLSTEASDDVTTSV